MLDINRLDGVYRTGFETDDGCYITPVGRLSYSSFFEKTAHPQSPENKNFNCESIFNTGNISKPGIVDLNPFKSYVEKIIGMFFAEKGIPVPFEYNRRIFNGLKKPDKEGYGAGMEYIGPKSYDDIPNILVLGQAGPSEILQKGQFKDGDFFRWKIRAYISATHWTSGVSYSLRSAQLVLPWEAFASATPDTGEGFDAVPAGTQTPQPVGW